MMSTCKIKRLLGVFAIAILGACAQVQKPMYAWGSFPRQQYDTLLRSGANTDEQVRVLQAHAEAARASDAALPPGFRGHLGMLQLSAGNPGEARALWEAEKTAFPEATSYMDQLLKRLDAPTAERSGK